MCKIEQINIKKWPVDKTWNRLFPKNFIETWCQIAPRPPSSGKITEKENSQNQDKLIIAVYREERLIFWSTQIDFPLTYFATKSER